MTSVLHLGPAGAAFVRAVELPDFNSSFVGNTTSIERLATESIGFFYLTLTNLVIGSVVRIEIESTGVEVETRTASAVDEDFAVPAYLVGNASNDLRIKVRKGSNAPFYQPFETLATAVVGSQSIYIAQVADE